MPSQAITSVENNFTKGLITEATGLNFPENAATDASNCEFSLIGDVVRRLGINKEIDAFDYSVTARTQSGVSTYVWNNPGGLSNTKLLVRQAEGVLFFYDISHVTATAPGISQGQTSSTVSLANFAGPSGVDIIKECSYADGNGYLFVYQDTCDPFYCTYIGGIVTANLINLQIRDFTGTLDNLPVSFRPPTLSSTHQYNLQNQGWTQGSPWAALSSTSLSLTSGSFTFAVAASIPGISNGQIVSIAGSGTGGGGGKAILVNATGTVTGYSGTLLTINVSSSSSSTVISNWTIEPLNNGYLNTWVSAIGNYPSNADVWWYFKNSSNVFDPATTSGNVTLSTGNAPQGHYLLNPFTLDRSTVSSTPGIAVVKTVHRPTTGAWFQGRVWYAGVNDSAAATSTTDFYNWNSNIYYSTTVGATSDFGVCYQTNDPTSENLNGELPTDGGVVVIPESGTVYKLFSIQNGMLVFANNGIWFITGSQGIGFASNDYTVTKISSIRTLSSQSFVDVNGLPFFWNEEGIYQISPSQGGGLSVEPITVGTILTFYNNIPLVSKIYARGSYDPVDYRIQWVYRSTPEVDLDTDRYFFDSILNFNTYNKAFYPYFLQTDVNNQHICGVNYITYPTPVDSPLVSPGFKYISFNQVQSTMTIAEEYDSNFVDWGSVNYISTFTTGYKVHGKGLYKFSIPYISVFSRTSGEYLAYYIQGIWDYATSSDSNRYSSKQFVEIYDSNFNMVPRRHKIRGRGLTLQIKFTSVDGEPFDFMGWAIYEALNSGV